MRVNFCNFHSIKGGNYRKSLSRIFGKNSVKVTVLLRVDLAKYFSDKRQFLVFPHCAREWVHKNFVKSPLFRKWELFVVYWFHEILVSFCNLMWIFSDFTVHAAVLPLFPCKNSVKSIHSDYTVSCFHGNIFHDWWRVD